MDQIIIITLAHPCNSACKMVGKCSPLHLPLSVALHIGQSTWVRIVLLMTMMTMLLMMTIVGQHRHKHTLVTKFWNSECF